MQKQKRTTTRTRKSVTDINREHSLEISADKILSAFNNGYVGKTVLTCLIVILIVFVDLLISGNNLAVFLHIVGVEVIVTMVVIWIFTIINNRTSEQ